MFKIWTTRIAGQGLEQPELRFIADRNAEQYRHLKRWFDGSYQNEICLDKIQQPHSSAVTQIR
jgi:hypothetical protein